MISRSSNDIGTLDDLWNESKDVEDGNDSGFGALVTSNVCDCFLSAPHNFGLIRWREPTSMQPAQVRVGALGHVALDNHGGDGAASFGCHFCSALC